MKRSYDAVIAKVQAAKDALEQAKDTLEEAQLELAEHPDHLDRALVKNVPDFIRTAFANSERGELSEVQITIGRRDDDEPGDPDMKMLEIALFFKRSPYFHYVRTCEEEATHTPNPFALDAGTDHCDESGWNEALNINKNDPCFAFVAMALLARDDEPLVLHGGGARCDDLVARGVAIRRSTNKAKDGTLTANELAEALVLSLGLAEQEAKKLATQRLLAALRQFRYLPRSQSSAVTWAAEYGGDDEEKAGGEDGPAAKKARLV